MFEALVFLALGAEIVEANYTWNTGFVLLSLFLVLFGRMISEYNDPEIITMIMMTTMMTMMMTRMTKTIYMANQ